MSDRSPYPKFFSVRQKIVAKPIGDCAAAVTGALTGSPLSRQIQADQTVAIAVGSRGIKNLREIVAAVVRYITSLRAKPVIVPAMGSHGGATAEGQTAMLASLGIDPSIGCPISSSMETVLVGRSDEGIDIHFDKIASQADHVIIINRVKPHTRLTGRYESGLVKMLMIGLGKHRGAYLYHQLFGRYDYQLDLIAPDIVSLIIQRMPITLGLAIIEDGLDNTSIVEAVQPSDFLVREPELLSIAKARMPGLPFDHADLLIVDRIGKEISGTGMDTNVIGRKAFDKHAAPDETPKIRQIYVRSLSEPTKGNASGIGIAEYCHAQVVAAMDREVTRINCVTAAHVTGGAIPLTFDSDRAVLDAVLSQVGEAAAQSQKWIWIPDTLHLSQIACSESYWTEATKRSDLEIIAQPQSLNFGEDGNLLPI